MPPPDTLLPPLSVCLQAKANKARRERGEEVSDDDEDWE